MLKDEITILVKRLEAKKNEYLIIEHSTLFKYFPRLARFKGISRFNCVFR